MFLCPQQMVSRTGANVSNPLLIRAVPHRVVVVAETAFASWLSMLSPAENCMGQLGIVMLCHA